MKWTVGTKIGAGFAIALLILLVIGSIAYLNTNKLTDTAYWVDHTHRVLEDLDQIQQSVTDAETGQRGYLLTSKEDYLAPYNEGTSKVTGLVGELKTLVADNPVQVQNLSKLGELANKRLSSLKEILDLQKSKGQEAATQLILTGDGRQEMVDIRTTIGNMIDEENGLLQLRTKDADVSTGQARVAIIGGTALAFVILAIAGYIITQNISRPLQEITAIAQRVAAGDLDMNVASNGRRDEVGVLSRAFDQMIVSLRAMADLAEKIAGGDLRVNIKLQSDRDRLGIAFAAMVKGLGQLTSQLAEGIGTLGTSANQISTSTTQLASGAAQTATAVSEATTTVEEVRQTAQVSSQKSKSVAESAQKMAQVSHTGLKSTEEAVAGINRVRQQMAAIADSMVRLSEQSQTIGQIVASVEDLAAQSNILAVNASIEAARAGEHGKGFSVVAQEVRSLAEQSKQATTQVRAILTDIQKATSAAVMATEQGSKAVEAGVQQTGDAGHAIQALSSSVVESAQAATQIAASSQQQLVGVDQVAQAMESIKQASTQNVASARQLEAAANNLKNLGQQLKAMTERFKA